MSAGDLPDTERAHGASAGLDRLPARELVELLAREQHVAVDAVVSQSATIALVADDVAGRIERGATLHYIGAGTSGRLGALDAAEMPPTFGVAPGVVRAHMAGGGDAFARAVEGAEDDGEAGRAVAEAHVRAGDAVVGISASGGAPFVVAALERSRELGALTVALVNVADSRLEATADRAIVVATGPELLTGSTRLKAGTAQKIALNALSTAIMVRLGKVHGNLMVDVVATNRKLRDRALRLVRTLTGVDDAEGRELLERAGGRVKTAVVMARRNVDAPQADELLAREHGLLRSFL